MPETTGVDFHFVHGRLQAANVTRVILHQRRVDVEVNHVGLVLVGENLAEKRTADFFLHVEHSHLAAGRIDEDAEGERQVRFGGEVFDGLRFAVFEDREVVFGKVGHECAMLVLDVKEKSDDVDADFQGLGGLLGPRVSARRRASGLWVVEFQGPLG